MNSNINNLVTKLLAASVQLHVWHLQTRSYAAHKALDELYEFCSDSADRLAEATMGRNRPSFTSSITIEDLTASADIPGYLSDVCAQCENCCEDCVPEVENILQDIMETLQKNIYLLSLS